MILLIDYGIGNLRSVQKALEAAGATVILSADPAEIARADQIVLPGVGAFGDGMAGLRDGGWVPPLLEAVGRGVPLLGICLGMQLLFERSEEAPGIPGLGLIPGEVRRFPADLRDSGGARRKVPHTGWNQLWPLAPSPLLAGLAPGAYVYFNHAYYCVPLRPDDVLAESDYGLRFAAVVGCGNLFGTQFHPEKSQRVGLRVLRNFVELGR
jgi:glutamine amidotransferase